MQKKDDKMLWSSWESRSCREGTKDRVFSAVKIGISSSAIARKFGAGDLKKRGLFHDLPLPSAFCYHKEKLRQMHRRSLCVGELRRSGELRPVRGAIAISPFSSELNRKKGLWFLKQMQTKQQPSRY